MENAHKILERVGKIILEKKGADLTILDVSKISSFTDYFVLCHGHNQKQIQAICDGIRQELKKEESLIPLHVEGYRQAEWILLDFAQIVVHIFSEQTRSFYNLEKLWSDAVPVELSA